MTHEEFVTWLADEVSNERLTRPEMNDLLRQKQRFDGDRNVIETEYKGRVVGYVADQRRVAEGVHELIDEAKVKFPDKMIYFEPIGFTLL
jgi:hypothetical protein